MITKTSLTIGLLSLLYGFINDIALSFEFRPDNWVIRFDMIALIFRISLSCICFGFNSDVIQGELPPRTRALKLVLPWRSRSLSKGTTGCATALCNFLPGSREGSSKPRGDIAKKPLFLHPI